MEGATDLEDDIPPQFKEITAAACSFYKVLSPLEIDLKTDRVVKCVILVSKTDDVIEIQNGEVKRLNKLEVNNVFKVVVHHQYDPFRRYVAVLTASKAVHLLDYNTLKSINSWIDVGDIASEDITEKGRPELILYKTSGELYSVSEGDFLIENGPSDVGTARSDAVIALNNKVKSCVWLAEKLEAEKCLKERFICQKLSDIALQLKQNEKTTFPTGSSKTVRPPSCDVSKASGSGFRIHSQTNEDKHHDEVEPLRVMASRQRIIHGKWVICIPVINQSESCVLRNLDLILHPSEDLKSLHYATRLMKTFRWAQVKKSQLLAQESDVIIEDLEPPILKPKKKAFLIALCDFPSFALSDTVTCSGIIAFESRQLNSDGKSSDRLLQQCVPSFQISTNNLNSLCVNLTREQGNTGLSFDLFALISASVCYKMEINSLASPLHQFIEALSRDQRIVKIPDFSDFYYFSVVGCDLLHLSAFVCKLVSAHKIMLTIYVRDDNQGMLLMHNLKPLFPMDAYISGASESKSRTTPKREDDLDGQLFSKMKFTISKVKDAFEVSDASPENKKSKPVAGSSTNGEDTTEPAKEVTLEWEEEKYSKWREELHCLSLDMESLFRLNTV